MSSLRKQLGAQRVVSRHEGAATDTGSTAVDNGALTPARRVQSADDYQTCYDYLRMTHYVAATGTWDAATLKQLAATTYASATKEVTIVGTSSELGAASGQLKFNRMILLQAIMALLKEECPGELPPAETTGSITNFGCRPVAF